MTEHTGARVLLTARRASWGAGVALLLVYAGTMAPGVTFWDAGEFIAAASGFGIPHPPGTPLFVSAGRMWTALFGSAIGIARASNLLSVCATALAGGLSAWMVGRETVGGRGAAWGALSGALCAGLMTSAWANATETEVYAVSLLHAVVLLGCASLAGDGAAPDGVSPARDTRWLMCTAYVIALAPAVHLSALVAAPAAIVLASRPRRGAWNVQSAWMLGGVTVTTAGVGRMSWGLVAVGAMLTLTSVVARTRNPRWTRHELREGTRAIALTALAASALLILLVRARHDPPLNQGNPATLGALVDVVSRRQYDLAAMWPRQAPLWIQFANLAQYADWQFALSWGDGIFTTPARVLVTVGFASLGAAGVRTMRRDAPRVADALLVLVLAGSLGVAVYLNLKAGASIGYGFVSSGAHEARERDYFFVLAFWGWGMFAGWGALALARSRRWPAWLAVSAALVPLLGNWRANDRAHGIAAWAARDVALGLLASAPPHAVLFMAGDNDSYPLWYAQQVEGVRTDVQLVTVPLLPADWYADEISRRSGLHWTPNEYVRGARWNHEARAALIARAARASGRVVAASTALGSRERSLLGSAWRLTGAVYVSGEAADGTMMPPTAGPTSDMAAVRALYREDRRAPRLVDDVSSMMLGLLDCGRLGVMVPGQSPGRDSLETRCNFR